MGILTRQFIERSKEIKNLKKDKAYRDGDGLYLLARPNGIHSWFYRFSFNGVRDKITIGKYKDITILEARDKALEYNKLLANNKNPKVEKEKQNLQKDSLFTNIAEKYFENKKSDGNNPWRSKETYKQNCRIYNNLLLPKFKYRNIEEIEPWELAKVLEKETPNTQKKIKSLLSGIFASAVGKGYIKYNIVRDISIDKILTQGFKFIDPIDNQSSFSQLLKDIDNYKGQILTRIALQLVILVGFRPSNIVSLKWSQINEENKYIVIQAGDMKMGRTFRQPLSNQAYEILMKAKNLTSDKEYVFSTLSTDGHLHRDSLSKALRIMGYQGRQHTHGFRKTARTYISNIRSKYNWCDDAVRMILSHIKDNKIDDIYDKNDFIRERREMLQLWADYVDHVKENQNVIRLEDIANIG